METELIRQATAANVLGVTPQYINKLVRTHKLKAYTEAKLVSRQEVEKLKKPTVTP